MLESTTKRWRHVNAHLQSEHNKASGFERVCIKHNSFSFPLWWSCTLSLILGQTGGLWLLIEWQRHQEKPLQLSPLSRWLDLMIFSEYSDMLEHSIWTEKTKESYFNSLTATALLALKKNALSINKEFFFYYHLWYKRISKNKEDWMKKRFSNIIHLLNLSSNC